MLKLDFIICGSPTDAFCSQIAFFRLCLDALGGKYRNARLVAVFGYETEAVLPIGWEPYFKNIEVDWVSAANAEEEDYNAQHYRRFELIRNDADFAIICDADIALLRPFDDLLATLGKNNALAGTIAHHPPIICEEPHTLIDWDKTANAVLGHTIEKPYHYSLLSPDDSPKIPFYINYGVLIGTPAMLKEFYAREKEVRPKVFEELGPWWGPQVSLTLACTKAKLATHPLPMRYNFPNDPITDQMHAHELKNIVFLHYLRTEQFDRHIIFATQEHFYRFINLKLKGSNRILQNFVIKLTRGVYPFHRQLHPDTKKNALSTHLNGPLQTIEIPERYNRNDPSVKAFNPEDTGELLINLATQAMGRTSLENANILDIGCGVRFTQTLINRAIPIKSYTGVEVNQEIVDFLKISAAEQDHRFQFSFWNVYHKGYNPEGACKLHELDQLPVNNLYDSIWLFSVFTHLNADDASSMLRLLHRHIEPEEKLFFSAFIDPDMTGVTHRTPENPTHKVYYGLDTMQEMLIANDWALERFYPRNFELPIVDYFVCSPQ